MELLDLLVRRHEDDHAQPLADQAVDDVQEAREALAGALPSIRAEQLAGVLHHEQAPEPVVLLPSPSKSSRTSWYAVIPTDGP